MSEAIKHLTGHSQLITILCLIVFPITGSLLILKTVPLLCHLLNIKECLEFVLYLSVWA